jgi:hypothetical protein
MEGSYEGLEVERRIDTQTLAEGVVCTLTYHLNNKHNR